MDIRPFIESDHEAVVSLWREVFAYSAPHNNPSAAITRKLAFQRDLFFVATINNELAGTVMGGYDGHRGWIYSLAVAPRFRRRGIGAALMRHVEKSLLAYGCPKINLQVLPGNSAVIAFYKKLGYNVEERINMGKPI